MAGSEIINLNNIRPEIREETAKWLQKRDGPGVPKEKIDLYTGTAQNLLRNMIKTSKEIGIAPEILRISFKSKF
ncbi:MAG: hypothetical protein NTU58_03805 [Candidatus Nealsonbacteria bacterium]|nr:hypothetical protein [Candidatus Nealsonbacteria bacterium]